MRVNSVLILVPLAFYLICSATAAEDQANEIVANIDTISDKIDSGENTLANYNGGLLGVIFPAMALRDVHNALTPATDDIKNSEPLSAEDSARVVDALRTLHPKAMQAHDEVVQKAPMFNSAGVGLMGGALYQVLNTDTDRFMGAIASRVTPEYKDEINRMTAAHQEKYAAAADAFN